MLLLVLGLPLAGCSLTPAAVTVGPATVVVRPPGNPVDRYFLDVHEAAHRAQFRREGTARMLGNYLFRPSLRLRLEAEAYATALCTSDRLQAHPRLRARLYDAYTQALRSYVPGSRLSYREARLYLDDAYRDGSVCDVLLALAGEQPSPSPAVLAMVRQRRSAPRATPLRPPPPLPPIATEPHLEP